MTQPKGGGLWARQWARVRDRIDEIATATLDEGETLVASAYAHTRPNMLWLMVPLFAAGTVLALNGLELRWWVSAGAIAAYFMGASKWYYVVLTDRRLLLARAPSLSPKRWRLDRDFPRPDIVSAVHKPGILESRVRLQTTPGEKLSLRFGGRWRDEAADIARRLQQPVRIG